MHLLISEPGLAVGKTSERIVVRKQGHITADAPIADLESLIIASPGVSVSSDALMLCAEHGVPVTFLHRDGRPYAKLISALAFGDAALRLLQLSARLENRGARIAAAFVRAKLANQAANLRYFAKSRASSPDPAALALRASCDAIHALLAELDSFTAPDCNQARAPLLSLEARAAQHYWRAIAQLLPPDLAFRGRDRRGAPDPVNKALNYGYGILYSHVWSCLILVGLDPYAGFLHVDRVNEPTLVYDFIEEFRQSVVDRPVLGWCLKGGRPVVEPSGTLDWPTRKRLAESVLGRLKAPQPYRGRHVQLGEIMRAEAYEIVAALRGHGEHQPWVCPW